MSVCNNCKFNDSCKFCGGDNYGCVGYKNYYITRGGFIQDRNGRWCKEGDRVKIVFKREKFEFEGKLVFKPKESPEKINALCFKGDKAMDGGECVIDWEKEIELIEPCEPDICKDFNILEE